MSSLLIIDDEPRILTSLASALDREGYAVETAASLAEARTRLAEARDFVLLDVRLPDGDGVDLLADIVAQAPDTVVVMMSGHATLDTAVRATRLGAWDFLEKPLDLERLLLTLRNATSRRDLAAENRRLRAPWSAAIVGSSPAIERLLAAIALAGPSEARVLIRGENGTGKELVARALHASSPRREEPFVAVNCAAIPEELIESELFGHERGAFTGATQSRRGRFEEAHRGTLFLDEVKDLSARAQTKLLRVLQEKEFTRVGGSRAIACEARVVSATQGELHGALASGGFREDLYFRLAVIPIDVPPLRERTADIPLLVERFIAEQARHGGRRVVFSPGALAFLRAHPFPGNVRELRNLVERLTIMSPGHRIDADDVRTALPDAGTSADQAPARLADQVRDFERRAIRMALAAEDGHVSRTALRLGLERSHLYKKIKQLGIDADS